MIAELDQTFPLRISEWLLSVILTTWGMIVFFMPDNAWLMPSMEALRSIESDRHVWGGCAIVIGMARLVALFINGAMRRTPHLRAIGAFMSIFIWVQLSFGVLIAPVVTMATAVIPWLLICDLHNLYRAGKDARYSDLSARAKYGEARKDAKPALH